ncbi:hypothetical protein E4U60_007146 [Claviceps pazoutovae]|uniref:3'-5' exonuclease domain-containing protein n=1 Tax=Claviceps pazoutovae TaxID=1649127 RepID=A0A9P7SJ85_9HYPO|nr:hypothetical protein E4U60_007146 [Claviceps pazoutovae]
MSRVLRPGAKTQLWSPETGICFAPPCWTSSQPSSGSLYPTLDMARFFHSESHGSGGGLRSSKTGSDAASVQAGKDDPEVEAVEPRLKSTKLSRVSPAKARADIASQHVSTTLNIPKILKLALTRSFAKSRERKVQSKQNADAKPPCTSLSFNICPEAFYAARSAKAGSRDSFWKYTMYKGKSAAGTIERVQLHYCTSNESMETVCKKYFLDEDVLGFDLEWLASATREHAARDNVSLIQIASPNHIALFHLAVFPSTDELLSHTLRKILEDATVSKVGVSIRGDCTRIKNNLGVTVNGIFELSHLYNQIKHTEAKTAKRINKTLVSLAKQVEEILGLPLFKEGSVRWSDWTNVLNERQLLYSASDAYAGIQLFHVLEEKRKSLDPCPERPHHAELDLPIPRVQPDPQAQSEI